MWLNPAPIQCFALASADGTVLVELPPTIRIENDLGLPKEKPAQPPPTGARYRVTPTYWGDTPSSTITVTDDARQAWMTAHSYMVANTTDVWVAEWSDSGYEVVDTLTYPTPTPTPAPVIPTPKPRPRSPVPLEDFYTWDRPPFSTNWYQLGDGLPKEKPAQPPPTGARYRVTPTYWGDTPSSTITVTDDARQAWMTAHSYMVANTADVWVAEWSDSGYEVVDTLTYPTPTPTPAPVIPAPKPRVQKKKRNEDDIERPHIVLSGSWIYETGDEAIIHARDIEQACMTARQLFFRGRTLVVCANDTTNHCAVTLGRALCEIDYKLTLYLTDHLTAQELMRSQMT